MLCRIGLHDWTVRGTARRGTYVSRCARCGAVKVRHKVSASALRRQQLFARGRWFLVALSVSLVAWYLAVALGLTGHTKILWGAMKVRDKIVVVGTRASHIAGNAADAPDSKHDR